MTTKITSANLDPATIPDPQKAEFNTSLLGFKIAVNEGLTVFNLVDGIVDEFHDESGTDEGEGSNDLYCASCDMYKNQTAPVAVSAGFSVTARTESDTSTAGTNPASGSGTFGTFTVPSGLSSVDLKVWGAGGGGGRQPNAEEAGGGGGFAEGTLAVTATQVLYVSAGEKGHAEEGLFQGGESSGAGEGNSTKCGSGGGGGLAGVFAAPHSTLSTAPQAYVVAGSGGGAGCGSSGPGNATLGSGGAGGGLIGDAGFTTTEQVEAALSGTHAGGGGGGSQTVGGDAGEGNNPPSHGPNPGYAGALFQGGEAADGEPQNTNGTLAAGGGGAGYYGGGGGGFVPSTLATGQSSAPGGGGSSYYGHPQVTSGSTEEGAASEGGGTADPQYQSSTNEGGNDQNDGEDGYVFVTGSACGATTSTTIVSNAFTASSEPSTSRVVVFQENIATPTLNTDVIASVSRDGGSNFTNFTLADSGYVVGSSGQRILTGTATISGQPSGTSMRWKLALANNAVKIHGVSLQWG
jgi:hypothetical protein